LVANTVASRGRYGVRAIGTAEEFQWMFSGRNSPGSGFTLFKEQRVPASSR